jgi:putative RNA 2'-phosphotransferase
VFSSKEARRISKFISLVLRHRPELAGLQPDARGWVPVEALLQGLAQHNRSVSRDELDYLVAHNPKKRYAYSEDGQFIRAQQGHSIEVELDYVAQEPPEYLFHGTATRHLDGIRKLGLIKGSRHHVHLSQDQDTAAKVGQRHGKLVILKVKAGQMHQEGHAFYCTPNQVWLTDQVPVDYLHFP